MIKLNLEEFTVSGEELILPKYETVTKKLYKDTSDYENLLTKNKDALSELQEILTANASYSLLVLFQAMDTGGKDEAIKYIMDCFNQQACKVTPFKKLNETELKYPFLKKAVAAIPGAGEIAIFNRSYYEHVLIERVHPKEINKTIPDKLVNLETLWSERFEDINNFEKHLYRNGTKVIKFFLHISKDEQKKRILERIQKPNRNWEFTPEDIKERKFFDKYIEAYQDVIKETDTDYAPWYIIPSDDDKNARLIISSILIEYLKSLEQKFPELEDKEKFIKDLEKV